MFLQIEVLIQLAIYRQERYVYHVTIDIILIILVEQFFTNFIMKEMTDSGKITETIIALSCNSRSRVVELMKTACDAARHNGRDPQDHILHVKIVLTIPRRFVGVILLRSISSAMR